MTDQSKVTKILDQTKKSLIEIYFELQNHYEEIYGDQTVVVMEVGTFYEVYGVDNEKESWGKPKEIAELLNLQLTRRNKHVPENSIKNPLLAGFPVVTFDRYISRLMQEGRYTVVIVKQRGNPPNVERYVDRILSPGVNFDYSKSNGSNMLVCMSVDQQNGVYHAGYASIDVTTGKSYVAELHSTKEDPSYALDALYSLLRSLSTEEIIIDFENNGTDIAPIRDYLELDYDATIHQRNSALPISYQNTLLQKCFQIESMLTPLEFLSLEKQPLAGRALSSLLEFAIEHDLKVLSSLNPPEQIEVSEQLLLGNNPLEQLSITSQNPHELTVLKRIDNTQTALGKRLLTERLLRPLVNKDIIEARYDLVDAVMDHTDRLRSHLKQVYDIERLNRRTTLGRLHPFEINYLFDSLSSTKQIAEVLSDVPLVKEEYEQIKNTVEDTAKKLEECFDFSKTTKVSWLTVSDSFFKDGYNTELTEMIAEKKTYEQKLELIKQKIVEILFEKTGKEESDFVTIRQLDKEGHYISLTKSRFSSVEKDIKSAFVSIDGTVYAFGDFKYRVQTSNVKISAEIIDEISGHIVALQQKIIAKVKDEFEKLLIDISQNFGQGLNDLCKFLAKIDVAVSTAVSSRELRLCRPQIVEVGAQEQVLEMVKLRHLLAEARENAGIYVPNDVVMGSEEKIKHKGSVLQEIDENDTRGVLLYGINSSGKSSLMKSIGISIVLAQAGFFVPATSMRFSIFRELFTRIVSKDNLWRGLSSFAVEMIELKHIFERCTSKSIILADEISHGTETLSALAIVSAAIRKLSDSGSLFICTTHLHQLMKLPHITKLPHVKAVHLSIRYDENQDLLIFDRKLKPGSGSSIYGLEFAESLHMDSQFLKDALSIRKELANDYNDLELLTKKERSNYNKNLYLSSCNLCGDSVDETHHITHQELADKFGNIGHFHKDHKANLVPICDGCHDKVHRGEVIIKGYIYTNKGLKLDFEEVGTTLEE